MIGFLSLRQSGKDVLFIWVRCLLFFGFTLGASQAASIELSHRSLAELHSVSKKIVEQSRGLDRGETVYISVGRSGVVIAGFLEELMDTHGAVLQIPLSDFLYNPNGQAQLSAKQEAKLFKHFSKYFDLSNLKVKEVLAFDFTDTGRSLFGFTAYFQKWLRNNSSPVKVFAIPIQHAAAGSSKNEQLLQYGTQAYGISVKPVVQISSEMSAMLYTDSFHEYAPYGMYSFTYKIFESQKQNALYEDMKNHIKEWIDESGNRPKISPCNSILRQKLRYYFDMMKLPRIRL